MLNLTPVLHAKFQEFVRDVEANDALTTRELALVAYTVALTRNDQDAVRAATVQAKQAGLSNDELGAVAARVLVATTKALGGGKATAAAAPAGAPANQANACCR